MICHFMLSKEGAWVGRGWVGGGGLDSKSRGNYPKPQTCGKYGICGNPIQI